jgi:hypothetical protein
MCRRDIWMRFPLIARWLAEVVHIVSDECKADILSLLLGDSIGVQLPCPRPGRPVRAECQGVAAQPLRRAYPARGHQGYSKTHMLSTRVTTVMTRRTRCACRKSNPDILMVQSAQHWPAENVPGPLNGARGRRVLVQR